jgi:hypothetical protein
MLYWNEISNDLTKIYLHGFVVHVFKFIWRSYKCSMHKPFVTRQISIHHSSTQKAFCTTAAAILLQWCQGRWRGADVIKECLEQILIYPLHYYANCVSTTLTVLITLKVSISFIVTLYFFHVISKRTIFEEKTVEHKILCSLQNFSFWDELSEICWKIYRVIYKSLRDVRPLRYSSRDGHAEGEHVNRRRDTPSFCPTLQVLDMSFLLCLSWLLRSRVRKFRRDLRITPYVGLHVEYPLLLSDFNQIWIFSTDFPVTAELFHADGQADRHDKANSCLYVQFKVQLDVLFYVFFILLYS